MKNTAHRRGVGRDGKVTATETPAMAITRQGKGSRVSQGGSAGLHHLTRAMMTGTENRRLYSLYYTMWSTLLFQLTRQRYLI